MLFYPIIYVTSFLRGPLHHEENKFKMADHSAASSTVLTNHVANSKRRNNNWSDEEVISLCDVWKEYLNDLRAQKRNCTVYEKMSKKIGRSFH